MIENGPVSEIPCSMSDDASFYPLAFIMNRNGLRSYTSVGYQIDRAMASEVTLALYFNKQNT